MTKEFDDTNRGVLFINDRKETDRHPDYAGKININGVEHWLSGWKKVISKGQREGQAMLSLSIGDPVEKSVNQAKQAAQGNGYARTETAVSQDDGFDDDIPF